MRTIRIGSVVAAFTLLALIAPGCGDDDGGGDESGGSGGKASGGAGGAKGGSGGKTGGAGGGNTGGSKGGNGPTGGNAPTGGGMATGGEAPGTGGAPAEGGSPGTGGAPAEGGSPGTGGSAEGGSPATGGAGGVSGGGGVGGELEGGTAGSGGEGGESATCQTGYIVCKGDCIDPLSDEDFCGATGACNTNATNGTDCANNQTCQQGICCGAGQINCDDTCVDPLLNETYCGATGACDTPATNGDSCNRGGAGTEDDDNCSAGHCCPPGEVYCDGECIDPTADEDYCGASANCNTTQTDGTECTGDQNCVEGVCCDTGAGMVVCNGTCIDPRNNESFCGADSPTCAPENGDACSGETSVCCRGACVDPQESDTHCAVTTATVCTTDANDGTDCTTTGDQCSNGHCCDMGWVWCGNPGACIDPDENDDYCGVDLNCMNGDGPLGAAACGGTDVCNDGQCEAP